MMEPTFVALELRANGFCILNLEGNITLYSHYKPFTFGATERVIPQDSDGRYSVEKTGQFATDKLQPYEMCLL